LKSSLKCSRGRRVIVSEPSTPPGSKSVRFKDTDGELESVCFFRATGRPYSISHPRSHSDTETETDNTDGAPTGQRGRTTFTLAEISPVPSPQTPPESNVHLESIALLPARPPFLRGTVRVRNLAFEKSVSVRFTTDGWTTVSEAHARYVGPAGTGDWDLFAFTIPLEAPPLHPRALLLAVRYAVPGAGEWWDNNGGADFRVVLAPKTPPPRPAPVPGSTPG
ncbi:putative phosphatase regulatory subunit-domain-containing protein, partial [Lactarius pseudohatsudake]